MRRTLAVSAVAAVFAGLLAGCAAVYQSNTVVGPNSVYEFGVAGCIPLYRNVEAMELVRMRAQGEWKGEHRKEPAAE